LRYPAEAQRKGITGTVNIAIIIDENGAVAAAEVVSSTDPIFNASAVEAVKRWQFTPAKRNGRLMKLNCVVPVCFQLK